MSTEFEIVSVARKASSHVTATAVTLLPPQEGSSKEEDLIPTSVEEVIVETTNQERKEKEGEESKDSIRLENTLELEATVEDGVESVFQCGNSANECVKNSSSEFVSSKKDFLNTTTTEVAIKKSTDEGDFPNDVKCPLTNEEGSMKTAKEGVEAIEKSSGRLVNDLESGDSGRTEDLTSERILCLQGDAACDTTSVDFAHQVIVSCDSPSGGAVHEAQNPPCSSDAALADPLGDDETAPSRSPVSPFPLPPLPPPPFSPPSSRSSPVPFSDPSAIHPPFSGILHSHRESHPVTDLPHLSSLPSSPVPCSTPPPASFDPEENPEEKPTPAPLRLSLPLPPEALPEFESSEEGVLNFDTHCRSPPDHSSHSPYFMGEVSTTPPLPRCARTPTPPVSPSPEESSVNIRVDSSLGENSHGAFLKFTSPPGDEDRSKSSAESGEAAIQTEEKDPKVLSGDSLSLEGTPERLPEMPEEAYIRRILRSMNIEEGEFRSRVISSKSDAPSPSKNSRRRRAERRAGTFPPGSSRKPLEVIVEEEKHSGSGEESGGNSGRIATNSSRRRKRRMRRESEGSSGKEVKTPEESSGEEGEYFPRVIEGLVQKVTEPPDAPAMQGPAEVVVIEEVEDAEEGGEWSEGWREEEFVEGEEEAASVEDKGVANVVTAEESEAVEPPQQPQLTRRMSRELFIIPESDEEREEREQAVEGGVVERGGGVEAGKPAPDLDAVSPEAAVTERVQEEERGGDASECKENGGEEGGAGMFCETEGVGLEAVEAAEGGGKGGEGSSIRPPGGGDADESGDLQNKCDARGVAEDKTPAPSTAAPVSESEPQVTIVEVSSLQSECDNVLPDRVKIVVKEPSLEEPRPKSVDKRTPENIISLPETSEAVQEIVQETELEERTGSVNNFQNNQVIPVKEIHQVQLKEQSEVKENTSAQMEPVKGPPKPCDDEETSRPVGSESVPNTCYDVAESMSEDEEMLRSAEAALEAYSAGRESSRSPSTTTSQCTEICRPDQPESLLQMCVKTVSTLPYGMTVLREIWTSTPPVAAERDRRRSSAPSPESRSEGEGKGGAERPPGVEEAMFSRTSPAPSSQCTEPELDHAPPRVQSIPAGAQQDSNPDHWVPIPTMGDVNICLSPKQLEAFVPDPSQAARLLDMHVKFSERRGYHEGERARGAGRRNVEEEERGAASSWAQIHGSPPPPPPAACGVEGGGVEGSRLLPMLLDEEQAVEDSKRSGPADSSRSFAADSPRSLPRNSPRAFGAAALGMGLLPGEMPEGPSSPSSVGSAGDERRLKARALSEWLSLARSDGGGAFSPRSEGSPRSFCSPPPGGEESTEEPPTIRVCDVIRRFEMSAAASGFKAPVPVRHSLYFERKRSDSGQDGPGSNPGGVGESPEAGPTEDNVQKRQFDAEKYRISKQGDIAIEIAGASELSGGGHGKQKRPVSMPPAVTGGEIFRQQMYMEYMHKVAERAERKQHKVIKLTARAGTEVQGQQQQQQQPSAALAPTEELFVSEFMGKVRQRMERVGVAEDEEGGDRVAQAEGSPGGGVSNPGGADDDGQPQFIIEGGLKELPKHLREDTDLLLADDEVDIPVLRNLGLPHVSATWRRPKVCGRCTNPAPSASGAAGARPKSSSITGNLLAEIDSALGGALKLDGGSIALAPTFKATAVRPPGVWTPSKSVEDLRAQPPSQQQQQHSEPPAPQRESGATSKEGGDSTDDVAPIWVPKSAGPSPVLERKEFRPVNFDANSLTRKKDGQSRALASQSPAPEESFAWQSKESTETSRSVTVTSEHRSFVQSPTSPGSSFTSHLPKAQNPTITLLQKAREGQLPRGAHYLDDKEKMSSKENDSDIMYTVKKEYETEEDKRKRKIVELGPKKFEGIGPTTREGIPIILRSSEYQGIKEENQAKWYKKMYESLHCPGKDDEYVTVRYKTRRGRYPYTSAEGYLSEPDPIGYDSDMGYSAKYATLDRRRIKNKDYNFTTSTMPRSKYIPPSTKYGPEVYKNQPGRIEDYEPGHSSIAEKEAKLWWDEVLDIFDGWLDTHSQEPYRFLLDWIQERHANQSSPPSKPFMTHALKESGYESDSTLLFKRREENMQSLSPMEQKQAYKTIQMGGEVPLHGLRKPAPERPKGKNEVITIHTIRASFHIFPDDSEIEYFPISPHLTRIRVHKHPTPVRPIRGLMCCPLLNPVPLPPPPPPPLFAHFKRTAPSSALGGRAPRPPARRSSRSNSTLELWSRMMLSPSVESRPLPSLPTGPNVRLIKERLSQKLSGADCPRAKRAIAPYAPPSSALRRHSSSPAKEVPGLSSPSRASSAPGHRGGDRSRSPLKGGGKRASPSAESVLQKSASALTAPSEVRKAISAKQKDSGEWSGGPSAVSGSKAGKRHRDCYSPSRALGRGSSPKSAPVTPSTAPQSAARREAKRKPAEAATSTAARTAPSTAGIRKTVRRPCGSTLSVWEGKNADKDVGRSHRLTPVKSAESSPVPKVKQKEEVTKLKSHYPGVCGSRRSAGRRNGSTPSSRIKTVIEQVKNGVKMSSDSLDGKECRKKVKEKKLKGNNGKKPSFDERGKDGAKDKAEVDVVSDRKVSEVDAPPTSRIPCRLIGGANADPASRNADPREPKSLTSGKAHPVRETEESTHSLSIVEPRISSFFTSLFQGQSDFGDAPASFPRVASRIMECAVRPRTVKTMHRSEPALQIYLAQRRAVSESRFRVREKEEGILARSAPVSPQRSAALHPPRTRSLSCRVTMFAELAPDVGNKREFRSLPPHIEKERSSSEPPPTSKSQLDSSRCSRDRKKTTLASPPPSPSVSPVRSATCRRIRAEKARAMARSADGGASEEYKDPGDPHSLPCAIAKDKDTPGMSSSWSLDRLGGSTSLNIRHKPDYQEYIADKLLSRKKSERFKDLYKLYASLERVGQLEKTASSLDLRKLKGSEALDYDKWRKLRAKEKAEEELHTLYGQLRAAQRDKRFLFRPKEVESVRWRGDRGLRIKEKSVEKLRELFCRAALEAASTRSQTSKLKALTDQPDVYKPLWRASSVINLAGSFASLQSRGRTLSRDGSVSSTLSRFSDIKAKASSLCKMPRLGSGRLWSSLSMEQMSALKSQLSDIYGSMSNVRRSWRGKSAASGRECASLPEKPISPHYKYEVDVEAGPKAGKKRIEGSSSLTEALRVRCNSVLGSDQLYSPFLRRKEAKRTTSLKADSIAYIPTEEKAEKQKGSSSKNVSAPKNEGEKRGEDSSGDSAKSTLQRGAQTPLSENEKKRLSMTLGQELMDRMTRHGEGEPLKGMRISTSSSYTTPSASVQLKTPTSPTQSEVSPRTCYSLELSDDSENKGEGGADDSKGVGDLLLVLEPLDGPLESKSKVPKGEKTSSRNGDRSSGGSPKSSGSSVAGSPRGRSRGSKGVPSASESDSVSSDTSSKTVIRREVSEKVDFFEEKIGGGKCYSSENLSSVAQKSNNGDSQRGIGGSLDRKSSKASKTRARSVPGALTLTSPENLRPVSGRLAEQSSSSHQSRSYTDIKELFGERSRQVSRSESPVSKDRPPSHSSIERQSFHPFAGSLGSLSAWRQRSPMSRACSLPHLRSRSASPDPTKYWRSYLNVVKCGDVRKLRERFESMESGLSDDKKFSLRARSVEVSPVRFRSNPELNRMGKSPKRVVIRDAEAGDVRALRRRYEGSPPRGRTLSPVPRAKFRLGDRYMPRLNVISKTAALQRRGRERSLRAVPRRDEARRSDRPPPPQPSSAAGVDRIRRQFEWLSTRGRLSLLGQMYTSAPSVREICDLAPYLGWAPPHPPLPTHASTPDLRSPRREARPRPASASPQPRPSILRLREQQPRPRSEEGRKELLRSGAFAGQTFDPSAHRPRHRYLPGEEPIPSPLPALPWTSPGGRSPLPPASASTLPWCCREARYRGCPCPQQRNVTFKESPHKYVESEVTIHYRSPIRAQAKEALPEEELARRQEEAMRRIYQEERRRKYLQELQDMESRRHTDNFTPSQKSPIPLNRYDNFLDDVPSKSKLRDHTPEPKVVARALYNFVGQTSRELSFRRGDIIFVRRQIDKNWYEGEHNAMIGLFPFNYVEIIPYDGIRTIPKRPTEGQARAKYNFVAQTHLELSLIKGELVVLTRQVDNNWFEGRIGNRRGIFPISYVEVLVEPGERPVTPSSKSATMKSLTSPVSSSLLLNGSSVLSNAAHSQQQPYHQQYLGKQQKQYQAPASYSSQKTTTFTSSLGRNPYSSKTRPSAAQKLQIPSVNQTLHIDTHSDPVPYRALYNYKPQNEDELELQEGDTVYVMEKCDDGWYVGSSHRTGYFGTFPGNYVERI
ncbi:uncharacterized protein LOC124160493 [Ischnura elegans]|uniref:uncharacterized protein LOC124160493 n=1 Tax=Ischnura elegans TaxID=197161 RepID=UPI001ED89A51|nr:uncharacterized protein LOC124160493 [Ischnura elegans]